MGAPEELGRTRSLESGELPFPLPSITQGHLRFSGNQAAELEQGWNGGIGERAKG